MANSCVGKIKLLHQLARCDEKYRSIETRFLRLEKEFSEMANRLPDEEQDIAWAFVCTSDELDRRLLEIACDYIDFNKG